MVGRNINHFLFNNVTNDFNIVKPFIFVPFFYLYLFQFAMNNLKSYFVIFLYYLS